MSQRFGRGLFLSGRVSPLVLLWLVPLSLGWGLVKLFLVLARELTVALCQHRRLHPTSAQRARQMLTLVRDAVTVDADTIEREGLVAWAVYGVGVSSDIRN